MKVLITGATGLIGTQLVSLLLQNGISVNYLTTSKNKIVNELNYNGFYWSPEQGIINENCLMGVDGPIPTNKKSSKVVYYLLHYCLKF